MLFELSMILIGDDSPEFVEAINEGELSAVDVVVCCALCV